MLRDFTEASELVQIPDTIGHFLFRSVVGRGLHSLVVSVVIPETEEILACKIIPKSVMEQKDYMGTIEKDYRTRQHFQHPGILKTKQIFAGDDQLYIISEFCDNGTLFDYLSEGDRVTEEKNKAIFASLIKTVSFLHSQGIAHRSIEPGHILIDKDFNAKLTKFNNISTTSAHQLVIDQVGSPLYAPPEMISRLPYEARKADVWALGVVLYVMFTGSLPWTNSSEVKILEDIANARFRVPPSVPEPVSELIQLLMSRDPLLRPTVDHIAAHRWLQPHRIYEQFPSFLNRRNRSNSGAHNEVPSTAIIKPRPQMSKSPLRHSQILSKSVMKSTRRSLPIPPSSYSL